MAEKLDKKYTRPKTSSPPNILTWLLQKTPLEELPEDEFQFLCSPELLDYWFSHPLLRKPTLIDDEEVQTFIRRLSGPRTPRLEKVYQAVCKCLRRQREREMTESAGKDIYSRLS